MIPRISVADSTIAFINILASRKNQYKNGSESNLFYLRCFSNSLNPEGKEYLHMAEVDTKRGSEQTRNAPQQSNNPQQSLERSRQGGVLSRRGGFPSLFSLHPSELLNANPFALMRRFTDEMDRMFEGFGGPRSGEITQWSPPVEISEKDGKLEVSVELPGVQENEVKVEVTDDGLVIQGERKREHQEKREGYYRSERIYGQFYRLIPLPENANIDQARAEFRNGELHISIPVPEQQHTRREIPVSSSEKKQPGTETASREQAKAKAG